LGEDIKEKDKISMWYKSSFILGYKADAECVMIITETLRLAQLFLIKSLIIVSSKGWKSSNIWELL
jgi:hypothetical protein